MTAKIPIWRAPRVSYCAQGRIWLRRECLECQTVNLSESGLLLVCNMPCPPGAAVRIDLPLPGFARPMPLPSLVVRETQFDGEYALAVKFETLLPGSLAVLRTFLQRELTAEVPLLEPPPGDAPAVDDFVQPTAPELQPTAPELQPTAPELQATAPELQPTAPELQATAPEPQATAPELQATAPELQATAPELQATAPVLQPIDLAELDLPGPASAGGSMPDDAALDLADLSNLSSWSPSPRPISPKKREVAKRLCAMVAARRSSEGSEPAVKATAAVAPPAMAAAPPPATPAAPPPATPAAPPPIPGRSSPAADDFDDVSVQDVPEFSAKEIYLDEERELIEDLPSDHKLRRLYHDAVAELDDNEQKLQGTFKKRKGWF